MCTRDELGTLSSRRHSMTGSQVLPLAKPISTASHARSSLDWRRGPLFLNLYFPLLATTMHLWQIARFFSRVTCFFQTFYETYSEALVHLGEDRDICFSGWVITHGGTSHIRRLGRLWVVEDNLDELRAWRKSFRPCWDIRVGDLTRNCQVYIVEDYWQALQAF